MLSNVTGPVVFKNRHNLTISDILNILAVDVFPSIANFRPVSIWLIFDNRYA